jgi:putative DNA primase/helicase
MKVFNDLPLFACKSDKSPLVAGGFYAARRGVDTSGWPLVAFPTGKVSELDVLDVDIDGLPWLEANRHNIPPTRIQTTRSGGRHYFFHHVDGLRCSRGRIAKGVDTSGDGGYCIKWDRQGLPLKIIRLLIGLIGY